MTAVDRQGEPFYNTSDRCSEIDETSSSMNVEKADVINVHGLRTGSTKNLKFCKNETDFPVSYVTRKPITLRESISVDIDDF